jgi:hypothetical protein
MPDYSFDDVEDVMLSRSLSASLPAAFNLQGQSRDWASEIAFFVFECLEELGAKRSELYATYMAHMDA